MYRTAWTQKASLTSDRIPPAQPRPQTPAREKGKSRGVQEPPKSREVRRLEGLRDSLAKETGREKDPQGGCFCQARVHALSPYTPICRTCGLILCALNRPHFACPHCRALLLVPAARDALLSTLASQIAETLAQEEAARQRALREAREAAGAFPTLSAAPGPGAPDALAARPVNQAHKVLSLNAKTKRVTVSSYAPPAVSRAASRDRAPEDPPEDAGMGARDRVPPPPPEVVCARAAPGAQRPWANLRGIQVSYVPPPEAEEGAASSGGKRRRKRKGKGGAAREGEGAAGQ